MKNKTLTALLLLACFKCHGQNNDTVINYIKNRISYSNSKDYLKYTELNINGPVDGQFNENISAFKNIKVVSFIHSKIPGNIDLSGYKSLYKIVVRDCDSSNISKLFQSISTLPITNVLIADCNLYMIPKDIFLLKDLTVLILARDSISGLKGDLAKLINLKQLEIASNNILEIDTPIFSKMKNLRGLNISGNIINPDIIDKVLIDISKSGIQWLDISECGITTFPIVLGKMNELHSINLSANRIKTIPDNISGFDSLRILNIQENRIKKFPRSFLTRRNLIINK